MYLCIYSFIKDLFFIFFLNCIYLFLHFLFFMLEINIFLPVGEIYLEFLCYYNT